MNEAIHIYLGIALIWGVQFWRTVPTRTAGEWLSLIGCSIGWPLLLVYAAFGRRE